MSNGTQVLMMLIDAHKVAPSTGMEFMNMLRQLGITFDVSDEQLDELKMAWEQHRSGRVSA